MKVLLPKAVSEQARWLNELANSGAEIISVDPWKITLTEASGETKTRWLNIDEYAGVICISPTAAKVLVDALDTYWPMPPAEVHWLCNGPRTAQLLSAHGLIAQYPSSGHTAEDVLALPVTQAVTHDKWLIVKGEGGRVTFAETLRERGAEVDQLAVYQRDVDEEVLKQMAKQAEHCQALWLSSEFLGDKLIASDKEFWQQWPGQWWLSSQRLVDWAQANQLNQLHNAKGATLNALQAMIVHTQTA